jgi:transcriptional regulator with PAS, ATPase and Fis domain
MQAKLLRFLENRRFTRVGGTKKIDADVRPIYATLRPLEEDVRGGSFRADLFYRIQGITLTIPPLRERPADLAPLIRQLVAEFTVKHQVPAPGIGRVVIASLRAYSWPGNIRELRNVVEMLCVLRGGKTARIEDLPFALRSAVRAVEPSSGSHTIEVSLDRSLPETVDDIIDAAVALEGGNRSRAASRLGIGLRTVQRRLNRAREPSGR